MKKLLTALFVVAMAFATMHAEAAKRLGGGKSMGQQSSNVTQREAVKPSACGHAQRCARSRACRTSCTCCPCARTAFTLWWHGRHVGWFGCRFGSRMVGALTRFWR